MIGEHSSAGERKYYLSNLPADMPINGLASAIKARWVCEQAHQQLKKNLALITLKDAHGRGCTDTASCA